MHHNCVLGGSQLAASVEILATMPLRALAVYSASGCPRGGMLLRVGGERESPGRHGARAGCIRRGHALGT